MNPVVEQLVIDAATGIVIPERKKCKPLIRWVGGKKWLVPFLSPMICERLSTTRGNYVEPFLGGGAIALDLGLHNMILGDVCKPLVNMYKAVVRNPGVAFWNLQALIRKGVDKETYLQVRAEKPSSSPLIAAARFIYLSSLSFNGLYRENSKGVFNVPFGRNADGSARRFPSMEEMAAVAQAFETSDIAVRDFRATIALAKSGDVLYCDSPYYDTFSGYAAGGFPEADHIALAEALQAAHDRGVIVVASNMDCERVRELYQWAFVTPITERHSVGATGARRGNKSAVLIVSDESFLVQRS